MKKPGKYRIPILNGGRISPSAILSFAKHAVLKPSIKLGAPHVADLVGQGRNVRLCETCWRRYYGWWRKEDYRPNWDMRIHSDCHGCGVQHIECVWFIRSDKFYEVLANHHGRVAEPNRRIFLA